MLHDALPLVTALHIEKPSHLRIGIVSKQFRDVRSVSIYNLFIKEGKNATLDEDIATQSVHFLFRFSNLERVTFLGTDGNDLRSLNSVPSLVFTQKQKESIYNLLDSFSGAFDYKHLPRNLQIIGLRCPRRRSSSDCTVCRRICNKFPVQRIGNISLCLYHATSKELIKARKGGMNYLQSETRFMQLLGGNIDDTRCDYSIIAYNAGLRDEINSIIESSKVDFTKLNSEDVAKAIKKQYPNNVTVYLSESAFDYLEIIGIPVSIDFLDPKAVRVENLDHIVKQISEETDSLQRSMEQMRRLLARQGPDPLIQRVVESGVLPKLVELLQRDDDYNLQNKASDILTNVALGTSKQVEEIVRLGAIPSLVHQLGSSDSKIPECAAWALGNIAADGLYYRDLVLQAGIMRPLLKLLVDYQTTNLKSVRTYTWVLSNLCGGMNLKKHPDYKLASQSLSILNELVHHRDDQVVTDACMALTCLSQGDSFWGFRGRFRTSVAGIQDMIDIGVIPKLIRVLKRNERPVVRKTAAQVFTNMTHGGSMEQIKHLVDQGGCIPPLLDLLLENDTDIVTNVLKTLCNVS